jgi:hypothetical protein
MIDRRITVYERREELFLFSSSRTIAEIWRKSSETDKLAVDTDPAILGQVIRRKLALSRRDVPHDNSTSSEKDFLSLARCRSWREFNMGAHCIHISEEDGRLTIEPQRNLGPAEGFEPLLDSVSALQLTVCNQDLGRALLEALELARSQDRQLTGDDQ